MIPELAQAIRDLAQTGRLSAESEDNLHIILDEPTDERESVTASDKPKSTASKTGGNK